MSLALELNAQQGQFSLSINTCVPASGLTAVFGPSGCGKTTLLRCIAGLNPAQGRVQLNQERWQDSRCNTWSPAHKRNIAFLFQDARLLPHLSVLENIQLNRTLRGLSKYGESLDHAIEELQLASFLNSRPEQLSGGQQQRVALARALACEPGLILMDEPLSALDEHAKAEVMHYLKRFKRRTNTPVLYVSHAIEEVAQLADHLLMMRDGRLVASGVTNTLFAEHPELFQESQLASLLDAHIALIDAPMHLAQANMHNEDGAPISLWLNAGDLKAGQRVRLRIAAKDVSLSLVENQQQSILNSIPARVANIFDAPGRGIMTISLSVGSQIIHTQVTKKSFISLGIKPGMKLWAQVKALSVFD